MLIRQSNSSADIVIDFREEAPAVSYRWYKFNNNITRGPRSRGLAVAIP